MGNSCNTRNTDQDVEHGKKIQSDDPEKNHYEDTQKLFKIVEEKDWDIKHANYLEQMRQMLQENKKLLTTKFKKCMSIIHAAKYTPKITYHNKHDIINTIIDIGYTSYEFSADSTTSDNVPALFFVAAHGDYGKLQEIVTYFKDHDVTKIHDTREGDTILSFMIKFGNYFREGFLDCFNLLVKENIDMERVDYFGKTLNEIIEIEITFHTKEGDSEGPIKILNEIKRIVVKESLNQFLRKRRHNPRSNVTTKCMLFQGLIKEDKNISRLLNKNLVDLDDGDNTLLQLAIIKNNVNIAIELLNKGANSNHVVLGGNEEVPLVLAARWNREDIFRKILQKGNVNITNNIFGIFIRGGIKSKFLNDLLESKVLSIDVTYNGKSPLFYAIIKKNRAAIQSLLRRGSRVDDTHLQNINPKDLEDYFNSCIKQDRYAEDMEENQYKPLLVFDFFINASVQPKKEIENFDETQPLINENMFTEQFYTEVAIIQSVASNKRLRHLLDHPLIYVYMILKWHCVEVYYWCFLLFKSIFYVILDFLLYACVGTYYFIFGALPLLAIQGAVVFYNYRQFKFEFRKYTLQFLLEIVVLICLGIIYILGFIVEYVTIAIQISAVVIIVTSLYMLLIMSHHFSLSKWMAMAMRVFKNFTILLLFFMIPIIAFATSFHLLNSLNVETNKSENNSTDFDSFLRAIFRTLVMLGGDIGDKKFSVVGGYIVFIFFTIAMTIILLNFWTGVAVSDIKEIEEQSTIVAFQNVIVFIESVERLYHMKGNVFPNCWLKPKICLEKNEHFRYGIHFRINSKKQFREDYFKGCKVPSSVISDIKSLFEEKEVNIVKTLEKLMLRVESIQNQIRNKNKQSQD